MTVTPHLSVTQKAYLGSALGAPLLYWLVDDVTPLRFAWFGFLFEIFPLMVIALILAICDRQAKQPPALRAGAAFTWCLALFGLSVSHRLLARFGQPALDILAVACVLAAILLVVTAGVLLVKHFRSIGSVLHAIGVGLLGAIFSRYAVNLLSVTRATLSTGLAGIAEAFRSNIIALSACALFLAAGVLLQALLPGRRAGVA